jgi:anti-anti-sigma factor
LEYICSLALRGLLKLKKLSAAKGGSLVLMNVTGEVQKILTMTGFIKLFDIK